MRRALAILTFLALTTPALAEEKAAEGQAAKPAEAPAAKPADAPATAPAEAAERKGPVAVLKTSLGEIQIRLDAEKAPVTVANFKKYVEQKFYDGLIFHRVIDGFMIQGGGYLPDLSGRPTMDPIALESQNGLKNKRFTIAMARTGVPDSATSQFFINVVDNPGLDHPRPDGHGYAVFGEVTAGTDVVEKIRKVKTKAQGPHQNLPIEPVVIESIRLQE